MNRLALYYEPALTSPTESSFSIEQLSGLDGWIAELFGKSQAWYTRVERAQNALAVLSAEVNSIGRLIWDTIQGTIAAEVQRGGGGGLPSRFPGFDFTVDDIDARIREIMITTKHTPSESDISTAESRIPMYRDAVDYAKSIYPEVAAQVEADAARVAATVSRVPLRSPAEVGEQVFVETLKERAKALGGLGLGTLAIVAAAAAIGLAIYASMMRGGRR